MRVPGTLTDAPLLERERELAAFDDVLGRVGGSGPRFVLVEGPPGIGKSRLIDELSERAVRAGFGVLTARAAHLEQEFAFGVVRQLFEPVLVDPRRRERLFAGAAASAARVFDVPGSTTTLTRFAANTGSLVRRRACHRRDPRPEPVACGSSA
jgi:hypothetical protein